MKPFLVWQDGTSLTKDEFDLRANVYAEQLRDAGYDNTCRVGVYSDISNIFKIFGAIQVCSPVIINQSMPEKEQEYYDVDIWQNDLPVPRYNQCQPDEVVGLCSSGSTNAPQIVSFTEHQYNVSGLDNNIQIHGKITDIDSTFNCLPLWVGIGFQTFCLCYKTGATYHILDNPPETWPSVLPTFLIVAPSTLLSLMKTTVPYDIMSVRHIRTVGAPLHKDLKLRTQQFFNCITTDSYGLNEIGTVSIMHYPQKYGSVGFVLDDVTVEIADDGELIANGFETGDLGYIDSDGFLFITGRKKDIIILSGAKIMPYEVELALLDAGASDCVVYGYDHVYALVVGNIDTEKLHNSLSRYKHPTIQYVDEISRKGQGKINRKDLLAAHIPEST